MKPTIHNMDIWAVLWCVGITGNKSNGLTC